MQPINIVKTSYLQCKNVLLTSAYSNTAVKHFEMQAITSNSQSIITHVHDNTYCRELLLHIKKINGSHVLCFASKVL